jgi:phosphoribosylglycinamide formyltransferase 1
MEELKKYYVPKSTTGTDKVNLVLIASGSGTDADSIMKSWKSGFLTEVNPPQLLSTKRGAGCLDKAEILGLRCFIFDRRDYFSKDHFNLEIKKALQANFTDLVFLVGCIQMIYPIEEIDMYNIHPADTERFGGHGWYGQKVHLYVLRDIREQILSGVKNVNDRFFTYPVVHEADENYDTGAHLLEQKVEIPPKLIEEYMAGQLDEMVYAAKLQEHVLPYEWLMLPPAVRMAARRILERRKRNVTPV